MNYFLLAMFLSAIDVAVLVVYLEAKKEKLSIGVIKVLGYAIILITILALICFSKL